MLSLATDLVATLNVKPQFAQELVESGVNRELIARLEKLGRGQLNPKLIFATNPGARKLVGLPRSDQDRALADGIEVMEDDEKTTRVLPVESLTTDQARKVFNKGRIRSLAEQRTYIIDQRKKAGFVVSDREYRVTREYVITRVPGKWSKQLIIQWLAEMG